MQQLKMPDNRELKARLPEEFSKKNKEAMHWILTMRAYFRMNEAKYV